MKMLILSALVNTLLCSIAFGEAGPDNDDVSACYLTISSDKIDSECIKMAEKVVKFTYFTNGGVTIKKFQGAKMCRGGAQNNYKGKFVYEFVGATKNQDNAYLSAEESEFPALTCANGHYFKD